MNRVLSLPDYSINCISSTLRNFFYIYTFQIKILIEIIIEQAFFSLLMHKIIVLFTGDDCLGSHRVGHSVCFVLSHVISLLQPSGLFSIYQQVSSLYELNENSHKYTFSFTMLSISLIVIISHKLKLHRGKQVKHLPWTD